MKLTDLTCPNCSGFLDQERDMFFCQSCGAGFNVDYDVHDVRYAQLITQASRSKLMADRDIDIMLAEADLKETALDNEQQRFYERTTKELKRKFTISAVVFLVVTLLFLGGFIGLAVLATSAIDKAHEDEENRKQEHARILHEKIRNDEVFRDNLLRAGQEFSYRNNKEPIDLSRIYFLRDGIAQISGDPQVIAIYSRADNEYSEWSEIHLIYKVTYKYQDSDETIDMYQHACTTVGLNDYNDLRCEFKMQAEVSADEAPWPLGVYYEEEQLYRECIWRSGWGYELLELEIPADWEAVR